MGGEVDAGSGEETLDPSQPDNQKDPPGALLADIKAAQALMQDQRVPLYMSPPRMLVEWAGPDETPLYVMILDEPEHSRTGMFAIQAEHLEALSIGLIQLVLKTRGYDFRKESLVIARMEPGIEEEVTFEALFSFPTQ